MNVERITNQRRNLKNMPTRIPDVPKKQKCFNNPQQVLLDYI